MPNNTLVGAIRVEATLDAGKFIDGARKIQAQSKQTEAAVKSSFSGIGAAAKAGIAGFVGALSIGLLTAGIKKSLDYAASLKTVSQQLGVTTKELQEFRYAAEQVGIKQEESDRGLGQFAISLSKAASGSASVTKAFAAVGVTLADINSKSKLEIFGQIADQMNKQGGAARNAAAGNVIFGESFLKYAPLIAEGSKGINGLRDAAQRLGIVLSDKQIQNADQTARKLDDLQKVLGAQIAGTVANNANSILSLAQALGDLTSEILHFLGSNPQLALGIIGAIAGSRFGGLPGAAVGAIGGVMLGNKFAQNTADSNSDIRFRQQQFKTALQAYRNARSAPDVGGRVIPGVGTQASAGGQANVTASFKELNRQYKLFNDAVAASKRSGATVPLPQFLAHTPKTHAKKGPRDRSDDIEFQFLREQQQADMDILHAKQQLAGSSEQRAELDLQIIQIEHDMQAAEINDRVRRAERDKAEGKITEGALQQVEAQAVVLRARNDQATALKLQAFVESQMARQEQALFEADDQRYRFALENLQFADQMATTQADHRRIQLAILDTQFEQRRLELEHTKQLAIRNGATAQEIANIQAQIDNLANEKANAKAGVVKETQSPLQSYFDSIPEGAKEIGEALENYAVKGIQDFNDQLVDAILHAKSLKDVFHSVAESILGDLLKLAIQEAELAIFKGIFGGTTTPGFAGGGSILVGGGSPPGFATGGAIRVGGRSGTDKNLLSLNGLPIARVSYGERINIANDDTPMGGGGTVELTMHNDFRGADPSAVASITARLNQMQAEFPGKVVEAWADANSRFLFRAKRR